MLLATSNTFEVTSSGPSTGTISGIVRNATNGNAINGAIVNADNLSTTTSSSGAYTLNNVPAGSVSVTASASGFVQDTQTINLQGGRPRR